MLVDKKMQLELRKKFNMMYNLFLNNKGEKFTNNLLEYDDNEN